MININLLIKDGINFTRENNTYHFISDENDRPWWSKKYKGSKVKNEIIGRIAEGDLFPIGENDKCLEIIVFFEKEK